MFLFHFDKYVVCFDEFVLFSRNCDFSFHGLLALVGVSLDVICLFFFPVKARLTSALMTCYKSTNVFIFYSTIEEEQCGFHLDQGTVDHFSTLSWVLEPDAGFCPTSLHGLYGLGKILD